LVRKLGYQKEFMKSFFTQFFIGVNLAFFPIYFIGIKGCPRKYKELPDHFYKYVVMRTYGATLSTVRVGYLITMFNETIVSYRLIKVGSFVRTSSEFSLENKAHTFSSGCVLYVSN
jgi:heme/copper-type cytochrome/quinol oxidase subunit 1